MNKDKVGLSVAIAIALLAGAARAQTEPATPAAPAAAPPAVAAPAAPAAEGVPSSPLPPPVAAAPASGAAAPVAPDADASGWQAKLYGFAEIDGMYDTTQSYGPASNNVLLARPGSYEGSHPRSQLTINNSLAGVRLVAPDVHAGNSNIHTTGQIEVDFFGAQPTDATEATIFTTPALRLRLFYVRLETPAVDVLVGQYHDLFAWGGQGFYQNSVAFLGVAGEIYHRNPQVRLSKTWIAGNAQVDLAVAGVRPVQRDSAVPDLQGGLKLAWNGWRGAGAQGFGRPELRPLAIGVSGLARRFAVAEFLTNPGDPKIAYGWGLAVNAFVPVIGARSATDRGNALSLTGEFTTGTGTPDLYTGLTGGALFPLLPDPSGNITPPPLYRPNIDSGIVTYDANGNLKTIDWRAFVIGLQYYLPIGGGRVWIAATYSRLESANILALTPEASRGGVFIKQQYFDGSLFVTLTPAVQLGLSFQQTQQTFGDSPFNGAHPEGKNMRSEAGLRFFF